MSISELQMVNFARCRFILFYVELKPKSFVLKKKKKSDIYSIIQFWYGFFYAIKEMRL